MLVVASDYIRGYVYYFKKWIPKKVSVLYFFNLIFLLI
jgi:hypothetical protein